MIPDLLQECWSALKVNPMKQSHVNDPGELWHLCSHSDVPAKHSSISLGIVKNTKYPSQSIELALRMHDLMPFDWIKNTKQKKLFYKKNWDNQPMSS